MSASQLISTDGWRALLAGEYALDEGEAVPDARARTAEEGEHVAPYAWDARDRLRGVLPPLRPAETICVNAM